MILCAVRDQTSDLKGEKGSSVLQLNKKAAFKVVFRPAEVSM